MDNISLSDQDVAERSRAADDGRSPIRRTAAVARAGGRRCRGDLRPWAASRSGAPANSRPPRRRHRRKSP